MRVRYREGPAALTERAQKVFQLAHQEAHRLRHPAVGVPHLLLGLAKEADSPAAVALRRVGFDLFSLRGQVERGWPPGPSGARLPAALPYTAELDVLLDSLVAAGQSAGVVPVTPELLLLALVEQAGGTAADILRARWFASWRLRRRVRRLAEPGAAADGPRL